MDNIVGDLRLQKQRIDSIDPLRPSLASRVGAGASASSYASLKGGSGLAGREVSAMPMALGADLLCLSSEGLEVLAAHFWVKELEYEPNADPAQLTKAREVLSEAKKEFALTSGKDSTRAVTETLRLASTLQPSAHGAAQAAAVLGPVVGVTTLGTGLRGAKQNIDKIRAIQKEIEELEAKLDPAMDPAVYYTLETKLAFLQYRKTNVEVVKLIKNIFSTGSGGTILAGKTAAIAGGATAGTAVAGGPIAGILAGGGGAIAATLVIDQERATIRAFAQKLPLKLRLRDIKAEAKQVQEEVLGMMQDHQQTPYEKLHHAIRPTLRNLEKAASKLNKARAAAATAVKNSDKTWRAALATYRVAEERFQEARQKHSERVDAVSQYGENLRRHLPDILRRASGRMAELEAEANNLDDKMKAIDDKAAADSRAHAVGTSLDEWEESIGDALTDPHTAAEFKKLLAGSPQESLFETDPVKAVLDFTFPL
jgi:hypothetical protein